MPEEESSIPLIYEIADLTKVSNLSPKSDPISEAWKWGNVKTIIFKKESEGSQKLWVS